MITLSRESETLLIPLYGRAMMSRSGRVIRDAYAEKMVDEIDFDFSRLRIPKKIQVFMSIRAAMLDEYTQSFLAEHPDSLVVYLGCGLDARFFRTDNGRARWYDLDFENVIRLKSELCAVSERYTLIGSSVTDYGWMDRISDHDLGKPTLVIAEGLLMYLDGAQVKELFLRLRDRLGRSVLVFDAYSKMTARHAGGQRSLKSTGAQIKWGVDDPKEIEGFGEGIRHIGTEYLPDHDLRTLGAYYRTMFRLAGHFKAAREAHRIMAFSLGKP